MRKITLYYILTLFCILQPLSLKAVTDDSSKFDWKKVVVGGGGYVSGVVFSEAQRNVIYCRTDVGGAYSWDSVNTSWIQLLDGVGRSQAGLRCVESIATDPTDGNRVYIAAGGSTSDPVGGVYWSINQGKTLNYVSTPFKMAGNNSGRGIGERLQVDPNSPNILFYSSRVHGLYKSIDYAKTWSKVTSFPVSTTSDGGGLCFVVFDKTSSTTGSATKNIYVAVSQKGNSLYKSSNAGVSWSLVPGTPATLQPHGAAIDTTGIMYLTYGDSPGPGVDGVGAVWKYNTKTLVWTTITPSGSYGGYGGISLDKQKQGVIMVATAVNWGGGAKIYRSINFGMSWRTVSDNWVQQPLDAPYLGTGTGNWIESLKIDPFNSDRVMYVTGAGMWAGNDVTLNDQNKTTHWKTVVKGIEEAGAYHILCPPSGTATLFTDFGDIGGFRHTDITTTPSVSNWFGWCYGHGIDCAQNNPNIVVRNNANSPYGYISTNNGVSWKAFASQSVPNAGSNGEKIQISANGTSIVWSPENALPYYSKDNGATWTACIGVVAGYNSMASDKINDTKFYYYNQSTGYIYVSTDGGANYTKAGYIATWGQRVAVNPKTEGDIWVPVYGQSANGIYHSVNSGASFTKLTNVQEASSVTLGMTAPGKTYPTIYINGTIGNQWGIYYSTDQGLNWARINDNQHQYGWIDFIVADQQMYGRVFLSPNCMGIPYCQLKTDCHGDMGGQAYLDSCNVCAGGNTGVVACSGTAVEIIPANLGIACTPNPFNESALLKTENKSIYLISNMLGNNLESGICNESCTIGSKLISGIYILSVKNGKGIKSMKIIKE